MLLLLKLDACQEIGAYALFRWESSQSTRAAQLVGGRTGEGV
jgi:hypothetical protein